MQNAKFVKYKYHIRVSKRIKKTYVFFEATMVFYHLAILETSNMNLLGEDFLPFCVLKVSLAFHCFYDIYVGRI